MHKLILKSCKSLYSDGYINVLSTYTSIMCIYIYLIFSKPVREQKLQLLLVMYAIQLYFYYIIVAGLFDNYKLSR